MFAGVVASICIESLEAWKLEVRMMTKNVAMQEILRRWFGDTRLPFFDQGQEQSSGPVPFTV